MSKSTDADIVLMLEMYLIEDDHGDTNAATETMTRIREAMHERNPAIDLWKE